MDKPIDLSEHVKMRVASRGTNEHEIIETIKTCPWQPAELNRKECRKDFSFNSTWNKQFYKIKQVRPIFVEDKNTIVVVTVYVYYF